MQTCASPISITCQCNECNIYVILQLPYITAANTHIKNHNLTIRMSNNAERILNLMDFMHAIGVQDLLHEYSTSI